MKNYKSNIEFRSNLYLVSENPYNDFEFIQNVFDPIKLEKIRKSTVLQLFPKEQEMIIQQNAVCIYYKKYANNEKSQYYVLKKVNNKLKDICRCRVVQCPYLFTVCRPNQEEDVANEIKAFSHCIKAPVINTEKYYPIMLNFNRVREKYGSLAYDIIANTDMKKYIEQKNEKVTFSYTGKGNGADWDNWVGGIDENNFTTDSNQLVPTVKLELKQTKRKNPMLELQRKNLKNINNPFFKNKNNI